MATSITIEKTKNPVTTQNSSNFATESHSKELLRTSSITNTTTIQAEQTNDGAVFFPPNNDPINGAKSGTIETTRIARAQDSSRTPETATSTTAETITLARY